MREAEGIDVNKYHMNEDWENKETGEKEVVEEVKKKKKRIVQPLLIRKVKK